MKQLLLEVCKLYKDNPGTTALVQHHIQLVAGAKPVHQAPYCWHPEKTLGGKYQIFDLLKADIIEESDSPWAAPIVMVPKSDWSIRLFTDFLSINPVAVQDPFPMRRVEVLIDKVGGINFLTKLDFTKGFWQILMD